MIELKEEIDKSKIIVRDFHIPLSATDRTSRQKVNKDIEEHDTIIKQQDLNDIYRTFHQTTAE